jgi:hypothetical protein
MATKQHLSIIAGDSKTYELVFKDAAGELLDISGWIIYFTVKTCYSDADADALIRKDVTIPDGGGASGTATIELTHEDTELLPRGNYYYSIQARPSAGKLYTLLKGNYLVEEVADRID